MKLVHRITGFGVHEVSDPLQRDLTGTYGDEGTFDVLALSYGKVSDDGSHLDGADVHNYLLSPVTLAYLCATAETVLQSYGPTDRGRFKSSLDKARQEIGVDHDPATGAAAMLEFEHMMRHVEALKATMPAIGDDLDTLVQAAARIHAALHGGEGGSADDDPDDRDSADTQEYDPRDSLHGAEFEAYDR